ncbi:MAG: HypC/HybG/HupF family hydrogenase formation chaperone [Leptospiraceae bacterium]|nr:HypC/HybG/HupF family hydrogenase formation chaperone [Leptospiraceae bacterium]MCP5500304.1 HypC/HybG/HupF family hydrogenase formation chaperone [Leptospiraceae bacterium]
MCLAVPMKISFIDGNRGIAEIWNVSREVDLSLINSVRLGDYVLVHAGFAISKLDEEEARKTLSYFESITEGIDQVY